MNINRRTFLRAGAAAAALAPGILPGFLAGRGIASPAGSGRKRLIFIFQRGGNDAVNTVIPRGDPQYSLANRPTLFVPENLALDLGNGFAQLHPMLQPVLEIYDSQRLTGQPGPGNLAVLHRIGYAGQSQSHFDSQQYWENGVPGQPGLEEGMIYRQVAATMDPLGNRLAAAAMAGSQMVALKGPIPVVTVRDAEQFSFSGSAARVQRFLGRLPAAAGGGDGRGLLGVVGGPRDLPAAPYRDLVYGTGLALADAMSIIQAAVAQGPYSPQNGAQYPASTFGNRLEQAAMLFKRTSLQVVGLNIDGWDTHVNQGQINGYHGSLLLQLAQGFRALFRDLASIWSDLVIVTMTEFGRTSRENASMGTDHAYATAVFVAGGAVRGGVYNCDAGTWAAGDLFSQSERYVRYRTDYRAVFADIFTRHFGDSPTLLDRVIPGYSTLAQASPAQFTPLGFLEPAVPARSTTLDLY